VLNGSTKTRQKIGINKDDLPVININQHNVTVVSDLKESDTQSIEQIE
jgi:hypothetical protein